MKSIATFQKRNDDYVETMIFLWLRNVNFLSVNSILIDWHASFHLYVETLQ